MLLTVYQSLTEKLFGDSKMTKKETKEFETLVLKIIAKYVPVLLLQRYTFEIRKGVDNPTAIFECKLIYPYLDSTIHYSEKAITFWRNKGNLTPYVIHEMCHLITDPIYVKAMGRFSSQKEVEDEREMLTEHICNIVLKGA